MNKNIYNQPNDFYYKMKFKRIFEHYKIIRNHPKKYNFIQKILVEIIFLLTVTNVKIRKNLLKWSTYNKVKKVLKKGDVVVLGDLKTFLSLFADGPVTHASIYIGHNKIIHARGNGIMYMTLGKIFKEYDTLAVFRIKKGTKKKNQIIKNTIKFAKKQLGKPYNYSTRDSSEKFFCTQFVNESFKQAGYETGLKNHYDTHNLRSQMLKIINKKGDILQPTLFLRSNFDLIYNSPNLKVDNNFFSLEEQK